MSNVRRLVPSPLRRWLRQLPGASVMEAHLDQLAVRFAGSPEELWRRSRERWRGSSPDESLTWGQKVSGEAFVRRVASGNGFGPRKRILELGPGYGRLLEACLELELPFQSYLGVDISPQNIAFLRSQFRQRPEIDFLCADFEEAALPGHFDTAFSSLTFKHLFPSFAATLARVAQQLRSGGWVFFDLIEGHRRQFDPRSGTYVRCYEREEVKRMVEGVGLELGSLETLVHAPGFPRLWVAASKPAG